MNVTPPDSKPHPVDKYHNQIQFCLHAMTVCCGMAAVHEAFLLPTATAFCAAAFYFVKQWRYENSCGYTKWLESGMSYPPPWERE